MFKISRTNFSCSEIALEHSKIAKALFKTKTVHMLYYAYNHFDYFDLLTIFIIIVAYLFIYYLILLIE